MAREHALSWDTRDPLSSHRTAVTAGLLLPCKANGGLREWAGTRRFQRACNDARSVNALRNPRQLEDT